MPDPVVGGLLKAAGAAAANEGGKAIPGVISRVLGPAADEIGEALRRYTAFRVGNVERIAIVADRKSGGGNTEGQVPPRVAHRLLEEGSYSDDELMAEYLGGVLAGGRTPAGRDDRAITWSELVSSLSTLQLRAHFMLYRAWAERLRGRIDLGLWEEKNQRKAMLHIDVTDFLSPLIGDGGSRSGAGSCNSRPIRHGLLGPWHAWGLREHTNFKTSPFDVVLVVQPSPSGMELFGWAMGRAGLTPAEFTSLDDEWDTSLPRLSRVALPSLPAVPEEEGDGPPAGEQ